MHPLGLSRGVLKDGFPTLLRLFQKPIEKAVAHGLTIDPKAWPQKDGYPIAPSQKAQIYSYSSGFFLISCYPSMPLFDAPMPTLSIGNVAQPCLWYTMDLGMYPE